MHEKVKITRYDVRSTSHIKREKDLGKWVVQVLGGRTTGWEISIVREGHHGCRNSWGWFDTNKQVVTQSGVGGFGRPMHSILWDEIIKLAQVHATNWNARDGLSFIEAEIIRPRI